MVRVAAGPEKARDKGLIMREQVFGIIDDHQLTPSPLPKATASPLLALRA
jgi:hypothetical protein